ALSAAPVPPDTAKGTIFPYPAKAPVVVCINGFDKARERLGKLLATAPPQDAGKLTQQPDDQNAKLLEGPKTTAGRREARVFVVLNDIAALFDGTPAISFLVPVTAHKEFLDTFLTKEERQSLDRGRDGVDAIKTTVTGDEMPAFLVDLKGYTAITPD